MWRDEEGILIREGLATMGWRSIVMGIDGR
jgi:hypothetical protein